MKGPLSPHVGLPMRRSRAAASFKLDIVADLFMGGWGILLSNRMEFADDEKWLFELLVERTGGSWGVPDRGRRGTGTKRLGVS